MKESDNNVILSAVIRRKQDKNVKNESFST